MLHFSVIMPLYNKALYVCKAVESVVGQTYSDWELIVVDDGSTDGGGEVVTAIADPRIRLVRQENAGVSAARNRGVALSSEAAFRSPYICFLDADDWWEPTFLEEMAGLIERYPDAGIYGTGYTIVDNRRHRTRPSPIGVEEGFTTGYFDYFKAYTRSEAMPLWTGAVCIPKVIFDEAGGFNPRLRMAEDFDLWVRIVIRHRAALINKPLSNYNQDVDKRTRAIGSLPPPETQFAFNADYLRPYMEHHPNAKHVIEWVQIVCLKQYYLSRQYHRQASAVLKTIDMRDHVGKPYSSYTTRPVWLTRLILWIYHTIDNLR